MELFIRGAWRSFGQPPDGHRKPAQYQKTNTVSNMVAEMEALTQDFANEAISGPSRPTWQLIFTEKMKEIKEYHERLSDCRAVFENESRCAITYGENCYLLIVDSNRVNIFPRNVGSKVRDTS